MDFESRVGAIVEFVFDFDGDGDVYAPLAIHDVACDVGINSPSTGSLLCECLLFFRGDTRGLVVLDSAGGTHTCSTTSFAVRAAETGGTSRIGFVGVLPGVVSRRTGGSNEVVTQVTFVGSLLSPRMFITLLHKAYSRQSPANIFHPGRLLINPRAITFPLPAKHLFPSVPRLPRRHILRPLPPPRNFNTLPPQLPHLLHPPIQRTTRRGGQRTGGTYTDNYYGHTSFRRMGRGTEFCVRSVVGGIGAHGACVDEESRRVQFVFCEMAGGSGEWEERDF